MSAQPFVSVVIPLYNKARHVRRALDSVLVQTFADFEVVVVDDGSTDGSGDVVRQYANSRVRLICQENAGVSAARNRGVAEAKTELIVFLDADDQWHKDFLETVLDLRQRFPEAALWGTAYEKVSRNGELYCPEIRSTIVFGDFTGTIDYFDWFTCPPLCSSAILVRKHSLLEAGRFPVGVVSGEDTDTWIRIALLGPVAWTSKPKAIYHLDATNRAEEHFYAENYTYFKSVRDFFEKKRPGEAIPANVLQNLGRRHTDLLPLNWLLGNRAVMREIVRDCCRIPGYRMKCCLWYVLSWTPNMLVRWGWKIRRRLRRQSVELPVFRSRYHT